MLAPACSVHVYSCSSSLASRSSEASHAHGFRRHMKDMYVSPISEDGAPRRRRAGIVHPCIVESRFACFSLYVDCCNLTFSDYMVPPLYLHSVSHKVCDVRRTPHSRWALPHSLRLTIRHAPHYTVSIGSDVGLLVHAHKHNPGRYMVGKRLACRMCAPRWRSRHRCRGGGAGDSRWRWRCLWNRRADCPPARRLAHHTNRCMSTCARRLSAGLSEAGLAALEPRLATSCSPT